MIVSIHQYELAADAEPADFRAAVTEATDRGLFEAIPGLVEYRIGRGIKGARAGQFAALWFYESRTAWESVWGPVDDPAPKDEYPEAWLVWEDELLDPVLADDPDEIVYTSYELLAQG